MTHTGSNRHLLLLAGAGEARTIAMALDKLTGWRVTVSHLHAPRVPWQAGDGVRIGGFGGDDGFRAYLRAAHVDAVVDATHPFSAQIAARTRQVCGEIAMAHTRILRPPWSPGSDDTWTQVADEAAAAALIEPGQCAFTTTGRATLAGFAGHRGAQIYVRRLRNDDGSPCTKDLSAKGLITPVPDLDNASYVYDEGPFSVEDEIATFTRLHIDLLIAKNSGGEVSQTKLVAARALGLPVILIARPCAPPDTLGSAEAALAWVAGL